jgi:hypothetical protein
LLRWADWEVDAVHDDMRDYVIEHLGDISTLTRYLRHQQDFANAA